MVENRIPVHLLQAESPELRVVKMFNLVFHAAHLVALMPQSGMGKQTGALFRRLVGV
jgi:ABC-type nitrate/sulfonate/bicarbonate transport system ATPase subunit